MTIIGNPLLLGSSGGGGSSGIVYVMDEPDDSGSSEILEEYIPEEVIAAVDFEEFDWDAWQYLGYAVDAPIEIGATYKVSFNGSEYTLTGQRDFDGAPALGDVDFSFSTYPFSIYTHQDFGTWYWTLMVLGQPNRAQTVEVYKVTQRAGHGGIVRHLITDGATITDTIDEHGGIVRNVTGTEVRLQVKRVTPGATEQVITADAGYGALGKVIVEAGGGSDMMIVEITNGTADHTFEEIFNALNGGTPVFLHIPANGGDDWDEEYTDSAYVIPVVRAYKYMDLYRVAAAMATIHGNITAGSASSSSYYPLFPAIYLMEASNINSNPTYYRTLSSESNRATATPE